MNPDEMDVEDSIEVDFSSVQKKGGGSFRIPKGKHPARVSNVVKTISQNTGNPQLEWTYELADMPGKTIKRWTALTESARWVLQNDLMALQLIVDEGQKVTFNRREAIGRYCMLDIVDDTYNGKETSKIRLVEAHPDGARQDSSDLPF